MSNVKYFSDNMVPLIGVNPKCRDDYGRRIDYFNLNDLPLNKKRIDGYYIIDDKVGFLWDATCCNKRVGLSSKNFKRYVLKVADANKSDSHDIDRSIEIEAKNTNVRNLRVNILDGNIRAFFYLGRDVNSENKDITFLKSGITIVKDGIKRERFVVFDSQMKGFTTVRAQELMYNTLIGDGEKATRGFRINDDEPRNIFVSRCADDGYYPNYIETKTNGILVAKGMLYHPEVNGTIKIVEKTINLAFPRILNIVNNMFPKYNEFVNGDYIPVSKVHEELEATRLEECAKARLKEPLLWVPTIRKK